MANLDTYGQSC